MDEPWFLRIKIRVLLNRSSYLGGRDRGERDAVSQCPIYGFRGFWSSFQKSFLGQCVSVRHKGNLLVFSYYALRDPQLLN